MAEGKSVCSTLWSRRAHTRSTGALDADVADQKRISHVSLWCYSMSQRYRCERRSRELYLGLMGVVWITLTVRSFIVSPLEFPRICGFINTMYYLCLLYVILLLLYFSQVLCLVFFLRHYQLSFLYLLINIMKKTMKCCQISGFAIICFSFNHYFRPTIPLLWPLVKYLIGLRRSKVTDGSSQAEKYRQMCSNLEYSYILISFLMFNCCVNIFDIMICTF